jgi:ribosome-binding factor A
MRISERSKRAGGVVREKIPVIISKLLTPNEIGFLTITAVEISGDLGIADVFVSSINAPNNFLSKLKKIEKKVSTELCREILTRRPMIIRFKLDKSVAHAANIEEHFKKED